MERHRQQFSLMDGPGPGAEQREGNRVQDRKGKQRGDPPSGRGRQRHNVRLGQSKLIFRSGWPTWRSAGGGAGGISFVATVSLHRQLTPNCTSGIMTGHVLVCFVADMCVAAIQPQGPRLPLTFTQTAMLPMMTGRRGVALVNLRCTNVTVCVLETCVLAPYLHPASCMCSGSLFS